MTINGCMKEILWWKYVKPNDMDKLTDDQKKQFKAYTNFIVKGQLNIGAKIGEYKLKIKTY